MVSFSPSVVPQRAIPLIRANPPRLSTLTDALRAIEASGIFSNNGRCVRDFEAEVAASLFGGAGACAAVANATLGLMLAIRLAAQKAGRPRGYAVMPSFTFAATAHAAIWAGLTPLLIDIEPDSWVPSAAAEEAACARYGDQIAVIVPYATFGNGIDLARYQRLAARTGAGVVVDAASSLGTMDATGRNFGSGSPIVSVFSMHATKTFATGEGGLIHSADEATIRTLRSMASFGFEGGRSAAMSGLNAKLSEISALLALTKLRDIGQVIAHRTLLTRTYEEALSGVTLQRQLGPVGGTQFMPALLPASLAPLRQTIIERLAASGIGAGAYFSPHLAEHPYFAETCTTEPLPVTQDVAARVLVLPVADMMTQEEVRTVCTALRQVCESVSPVRAPALGRGRGASHRIAAARP